MQGLHACNLDRRQQPSRPARLYEGVIPEAGVVAQQLVAGLLDQFLGVDHDEALLAPIERLLYEHDRDNGFAGGRPRYDERPFFARLLPCLIDFPTDPPLVLVEDDWRLRSMRRNTIRCTFLPRKHNPGFALVAIQGRAETYFHRYTAD